MRKFIFVLMFFMNIFAYSKPITLASFNIQKLGSNEKDYNALAKIISKFDIIVIQELIYHNGIEEIMQRLPEKYDYISSKPVGTRKYKEHFAIVYNKEVVDNIKSVGRYPDYENHFIRPPEAFYIKSNKLDIVVIPVHSIFGKNESQRAYEASKYHLVLEYYKQKTGQDDIIIMGDFNLPANDRAFNKLKNKYNMVNIVDQNIRQLYHQRVLLIAMIIYL